MYSYEEAGNVLDDLIDELPEEIFAELNGGICLLEDCVQSDDGRYTLGLYNRNQMGRYIELYYGSFTELYGEMDDELFRARLKKTLHHELTHHIENLAGDRSLERWDERQQELCGFNGIIPKSVLFVCNDNSALSPAAEEIFNKYKCGLCADVRATSAASDKAAESINEKALKACRAIDIDISGHTPTELTREMLEEYDVCLCMTLGDADKVSLNYQDLDERVMCLAEDDISIPTLALGWKRCLATLKDEVLAVIDEINQEAGDGV